MAAGERSSEYGAGIDCSHLGCVPNTDQKYAHSAVFCSFSRFLLLEDGWLMNLSSCHRLKTASHPLGFILLKT